MTDRPILFSAPMVRALLDGSKTQTRRVCKPAATLSEVVGVQDPREFGQSPLHVPGSGWFGDAEGETEPFFCPYGKPGDRLWVKETYWRDDEDGAVLYASKKSDFEIVQQNKIETGSARYNWKPSIFMRRGYSRITLEITGVRVERLQDISESDAAAEGVTAGKYAGLDRANARTYSELWESINGPGSWDANPWVWVVEFCPLATPHSKEGGTE